MPTFTHEWLFRSIVEQTQFAVIFSDRDGVIQFWNAGAEAMFGYTATEAVGQSLDMIVPERQRARHWEGYHKVMASGITKYGREMLAVPAMRKDGARISVEFAIVLLRAPSGEMLRAVTSCMMAAAEAAKGAPGTFGSQARSNCQAHLRKAAGPPG